MLRITVRNLAVVVVFIAASGATIPGGREATCFVVGAFGDHRVHNQLPVQDTVEVRFSRVQRDTGGDLDRF